MGRQKLCMLLNLQMVVFGLTLPLPQPPYRNDNHVQKLTKLELTKN